MLKIWGEEISLDIATAAYWAQTERCLIIWEHERFVLVYIWAWTSCFRPLPLQQAVHKCSPLCTTFNLPPSKDYYPFACLYVPHTAYSCCHSPSPRAAVFIHSCLTSEPAVKTLALGQRPEDSELISVALWNRFSRQLACRSRPGSHVVTVGWYRRSHNKSKSQPWALSLK